MIKEYYVDISLEGCNILFFYGAWSSVCSANERILKDLNEIYLNIDIIKVNTTKHYDLKKKYMLNRLPCYVLVIDGKEISRYSGGINLKFLNDWLKKSI